MSVCFLKVGGKVGMGGELVFGVIFGVVFD